MAIDGEALKVLREKDGWTAKAFAEESGISLQYLCDIEAGRRRLKRAPHLLNRFAEILKVPKSMLEASRASFLFFLAPSMVVLLTASLLSVTPIPGALTVAEAAKKAGVSTQSIYRAIARRELRAKRIGRCVRILDEEFRRWMRDEEKAAS